jgi:S-adenosylmethionine/arginine decarboxylase-like enzyme
MKAFNRIIQRVQAEVKTKGKRDRGFQARRQEQREKKTEE